MATDITAAAIAARLMKEHGYDRDESSQRSAAEVAEEACRLTGDLRLALEAWWPRRDIPTVASYGGYDLKRLRERVGMRCVVPELTLMAYLRRHSPEEAKQIMEGTLDVF